MNKVVIPELVRGIFDELDECDEQTPWMRSIHNQTLEQDTRNLLLKR